MEYYMILLEFQWEIIVLHFNIIVIKRGCGNYHIVFSPRNEILELISI